MSQTLAEMAAEAAAQLGTHSNTDMLSVLKAGINRRYKRILQMQSWPDVDRTLSITVAAGESSVGIPIKGVAVRSVYNATTSCPVMLVSNDRLESLTGETVGQSGSLGYYVNEGFRGAFRTLTSADLGLFVVSTEAADVGTVRVTGFNDPDGARGGTPFTATASLSGTTPVSIFDPGTLAGCTVETFSKADDTVGTIILQGNSGADELSYLGPKEHSAQYTWIRFDHAADTDTSLRVNVRLNALGLVNDDDVPALRGIDHILVEGALADGYRRHQQMAKASFQEGVFEKLVNDYLNMRVEDSPPIVAEGTMHHYRG